MHTRRVPSLRDALAEITDFRQAQGRPYELVPVWLLCCVAVMCGYTSQAAIAAWGSNYGPKWLKRLGIQRQRRPSQPTLQRRFKDVDAAAVERAIRGCWAEAVLQVCRAPEAALEGLALDGKSLRGSPRPGAADAHLLRVLWQRLGVVLKQVAVADQSNEIACAAAVLEGLVLEGRVVTADSLHTPADLAQTMIERGGDYLMVVKENQPSLPEDMARCFSCDRELQDTMRQARQVDQHGNRIAERRRRSWTALQGYVQWPGHQQVLELVRTVTDKQSKETRRAVAYGITWLSRQEAGPAELLKWWREHWHIEHKLHWVRDVTFDEDGSQVRSGRIRQVLAALRNVAISALRVAGAENIAAACRRYAARPALAFAALGLSRRE